LKLQIRQTHGLQIYVELTVGEETVTINSEISFVPTAAEGYCYFATE
jgi:hypothetical protein